MAVREYQTDIGPADYMLFVNAEAVGIIEAKREEEAVRVTMHEEQSERYATAELRHIDNKMLLFVCESTGGVTRFTDYRDTRPRSWAVFRFYPPQALIGWTRQENSRRARLQHIRG